MGRVLRWKNMEVVTFNLWDGSSALFSNRVIRKEFQCWYPRCYLPLSQRSSLILHLFPLHFSLESNWRKKKTKSPQAIFNVCPLQSLY